MRVLSIFLSATAALIALGAQAKAPEPSTLTVDGLRAIPKVCVANLDAGLAFQNDFDAPPAGLATAGVPANLAFTPVGIVGGALGSAIANAMIRQELFQPRSERMPRLVDAAGDGFPGEVVEAEIAARLVEMGVASLQRIDAVGQRDAKKALQDCAPDDGPFAVVEIRWSMRPELEAFQLAAAVSVYDAKRDLRRPRPAAELVLAHESAPMTLRPKVREDVFALIEREHQRHAATGVNELIRRVNSAGAAADRRDRQRASRLVNQHRRRLADTALKDWSRGDRLDAVVDAWAEGSEPRIRASMQASSDDLLGLFDAWLQGQAPELVAAAEPLRSAPAATVQFARFDDIRPHRVPRAEVRGQVLAPVVMPVDGQRERRRFGERLWVSSWNAKPIDLSRIDLTVVDEDWNVATEGEDAAED